VNLIAPSGAEEKIEFLGDGQQVVVDGIHPDTGKSYSWHGGALTDTRRNDLPYIRETEARELVGDAAELLVRDFNYQPAPHRPKTRGSNGVPNDGASGGAADWQCLLDNVREGRALHDSLRDLAAKKIVSGQAPGAVVNELRALMLGSEIPHDDR